MFKNVPCPMGFSCEMTIAYAVNASAWFIYPTLPSRWPGLHLARLTTDDCTITFQNLHHILKCLCPLYYTDLLYIDVDIIKSTLWGFYEYIYLSIKTIICSTLMGDTFRVKVAPSTGVSSGPFFWGNKFEGVITHPHFQHYGFRPHYFEITEFWYFLFCLYFIFI